jgi:uncharacterized protein (DUF1499 family)
MVGIYFVVVYVLRQHQMDVYLSAVVGVVTAWLAAILIARVSPSPSFSPFVAVLGGLMGYMTGLLLAVLVLLAVAGPAPHGSPSEAQLKRTSALVTLATIFVGTLAGIRIGVVEALGGSWSRRGLVRRTPPLPETYEPQVVPSTIVMVRRSAAGGRVRFTGLLLVGAITAAGMWAATAWPRLSDVETGRTPEYPDLKPRDYAAKPDEVAKAVEQILTRLPRWSLVGAGRGPLGSEVRAVHTTLVPKEDVIIRIRRVGARTHVSVRSSSQMGGWDFGQNARNIRELLAELDRSVS